MKVFTPNIKLVNKLTKYISPKSIEKARFEKFNTPIINDGNLLCDKFFRTSELFDKKNDIVQSFQPYSIDELPVYDRTSVQALDLKHLEGTHASYIETNLPYFIDIIGENKRIYLEEYGIKHPDYPNKETEIQPILHPFLCFFSEKLTKNVSIDEYVNITYHAQKKSPFASYELVKASLGLLQDGIPLEGVINLMNKANLKVVSGDAVAATPIGLMRFLSEYPKLRQYVITHTKRNSEVFDSKGSVAFPELIDMCKGDIEKAYDILKDCRVEQWNKSSLTNLDLVGLAKTLYKIDNCWNKEKAKILFYIKLHNNEDLTIYIKRAYKDLEMKLPLKQISENLAPRFKS